MIMFMSMVQQGGYCHTFTIDHRYVDVLWWNLQATITHSHLTMIMTLFMVLQGCYCCTFTFHHDHMNYTVIM